MRVALPKFQYRFIPSLGHVIHPGNFHPVGVQRSTETMLARLPTGTEAKGAWLVVGGSGGFGSAARAVLGCRGADTLNVSLDAQPNASSSNKMRQLGSVGFHRTKSLEEGLRSRGTVARSVVGDAFEPGVREQAIAEIREHFGGRIHGLVWALAAPRAVDVRTGSSVSSALKPLGQSVRVPTFTGGDAESGPRITEVELAPGSPEQAIATIFVMGGRVVVDWIEALLAADVLAPGFQLLTISYRGNPLNEGVYRRGLIGLAKADLEYQTRALDAVLRTRVDGRALAVEGPAVVTEASGGIPGVPFYMAQLLDVMGERFEDPLASMQRLFADKLCDPADVDDEGLVRMDDRELDPQVQDPMRARFAAAQPDAPFEQRLFDLFMREYARTRGFEIDGVDYEAEFETEAVTAPQ